MNIKQTSVWRNMGYEDTLLSSVNRAAERLHQANHTKVTLELDLHGCIEVFFSNNIKLSSLLPEKVSILNDRTLSSPECRTHYDQQGSISKIEIAVNFRWLENAGEKGQAILCHELGHTLIVQQVDSEIQKLRQQFFAEKQLPANAAQTPADVLLATQYSMQELGIHLDKELQAWDHGKSYKDLFRISDEVYESSEDRSIQAYVYNWTLHTRKNIERYASRLGTLNHVKGQIQGTVKIYDASTRTYIEKSFAEVVSYLDSFQDEEAERLNKIALSEVG